MIRHLRSALVWTMSAADRQLTVLLRRVRDGDLQADEELYAHVYDHLHEIARSLMRRERSNHTLCATELVGEAWLRIGDADVDWRDRAHFFRVAARAMRRALVDHARARMTHKRDAGGERVPLDSLVDAWDELPYELLDLDAALTALASEDDALARIVELRFFAGLTLAQTGEVVGLTFQQVHRSWEFARGWLHTKMTSRD